MVRDGLFLWHQARLGELDELARSLGQIMVVFPDDGDLHVNGIIQGNAANAGHGLAQLAEEEGRGNVAAHKFSDRVELARLEDDAGLVASLGIILLFYCQLFS